MYKIFLAWQSQNKITANFIKKHLSKAEEVLKEDNIYVNVIKSPTQDSAGSPNINQAIWKQIQESDIFIADLSFVSKIRTSNDNVMYELGIADALLGEKRTILLCDEHTKIEKLAFDINHKRISKINTQNVNFYKELAEWIKIALIEADSERFSRKYILEEYANELIAVVNYFYRVAYYSDKIYSEGFEVPDQEKIKRELKKTKTGIMEARVDFNRIIDCLEVKIRNLMPFTNQRTIWHMLNIISSLKDYQIYCQSIHFQHLIIHETKEQYGMYDNNTFYLNPNNSIIGLKGSPFFDDNIIICQTEDGRNIVLDKRIIVNDKENIRLSKVSLLNGSVQTVAVMRTVTYNDNYIDYLSKYIHEVLKALNGFLEYNEFELTNSGKDDKPSGIITIKLK